VDPRRFGSNFAGAAVDHGKPLHPRQHRANAYGALDFMHPEKRKRIAMARLDDRHDCRIGCCRRGRRSVDLSRPGALRFKRRRF
jgi:hypothetical protein